VFGKMTFNNRSKDFMKDKEDELFSRMTDEQKNTFLIMWALRK
jgi:hypothetical protein